MGRSMTERIDFAALVRPETPNTYLLAPDGLCKRAVPDVISPVFNDSLHATYERLLARIAARPRWRLVMEDPGAHALQFVAVSAVFRFRDDVDAMVLDGPGGQGSQLAIYSRSRLGHSDLGANRRRVSDLIESLRE